MQSIEGRRQRLFRRINMAPRGTGALVAIRSHLLELVGQDPSLQEVENDLRHLLASWFNRGFLEFQRISWETPADVLEKLIAFESVHEVHGWNDLRRRLAPDRRCYAFFHPALPREPLIFVEVALQQGIATAVGPILQSPVTSIEYSDTAIFYSISNCQKGLKGINFGNFLIKQVVDELQSELPRLRRFSTLSPIPGFRKWLIEAEVSVLRAALGNSFNFLKAMSGTADICLVREFLIEAADEEVFDPLISGVLSKLCAYFLCELPRVPSILLRVSTWVTARDWSKSMRRLIRLRRDGFSHSDSWQTICTSPKILSQTIRHSLRQERSRGPTRSAPSWPHRLSPPRSRVRGALERVPPE